jgi:hypothetical protein
METKQIHDADHKVASSRWHRSTNVSSPITTLAWLAAALLILLGAAFELGMLGYGPYNSSDAWVFTAIGRNAWMMLADLVVPEMRDLLKTWPLMLVNLGLAILLIAQRRNRLHSMGATSAERKENHAN